METINVSPLDISSVQEVNKETVLIVQSADGLIIRDQNTYEKAGEFRKTVREGLKSLETARKKITAPLDQAKAAVMDLFRPSMERRVAALAVIDKGMIAYDDAQEKKRLAEEERLRREADKKRQEAEAKAEEARKAAEAARQAGNDKEAEKLEAKAEKQDEKAASVVTPTLAPQAEKPNGIQYRDQWHAEVVDFAKLPDEYKIANQPMLNKVAQATKGTLPIPGVAFSKIRIVASRTEA